MRTQMHDRYVTTVLVAVSLSITALAFTGCEAEHPQGGGAGGHASSTTTSASHVASSTFSASTGVCMPGDNGSCNHDPTVGEILGQCGPDGQCTCSRFKTSDGKCGTYTCNGSCSDALFGCCIVDGQNLGCTLHAGCFGVSLNCQVPSGSVAPSCTSGFCCYAPSAAPPVGSVTCAATCAAPNRIVCDPSAPVCSAGTSCKPDPTLAPAGYYTCT